MVGAYGYSSIVISIFAWYGFSELFNLVPENHIIGKYNL